MDKTKNLQLKILNKYYQINGKNATIELFYDTFSELIDNNLGNNNVEKLNSLLFEQIDEAFSLIPRNCKVTLKVHIKDFGDYKEEEAERIIKENIGLKIYALMVENRRKRRTSYFLAGGGILLLLLSYFLMKIASPTIINDIINISGTLLVWEAVADLVIERNENLKIAKQYISKLKTIDVLK